MASTIGTVFRVTTFGESHGVAIGAVVDGCPANVAITDLDIQSQLDRRRPGQSELTTKREESDRVTILSGVESGISLGTPIAMIVTNDDIKPSDYDELANIPRPSHGDFTYRIKYGTVASSGGGRASARETVGRVAAGAVAERFLDTMHGIKIVAWVSSVGDIDAPDMTNENVRRADVDRTPVRCPDPDCAARMAGAISNVASERDSLGGIITCVCRDVPAGWGEPVFDKMEAALGRAMLSIPAVKGFENGSGFAGTRLRGSQHNDMFVKKGDTLGTTTNRSGGIQAGISNGELIVLRVAFKPTATVGTAQETCDYDGNPVSLQLTKGRHDPCVLPRAVPVVEAMAAIVLADMALLAGKD